jgi:hypothetical protein
MSTGEGVAADGQAHGQRRAAWIAIATMTLLALAMRLFYVNTVVIDVPIRGDAINYFSYASNLVEHGVYSYVRPGSGGEVVPDHYRDPGYPLFVALAMWIAGEDGWYRLLLNLQALLGAATVGLTLVLGRRWLPPGWLAAAGLLMAAWPHSITITSYVLTETLAGFLSVLWLALLSAKGTHPGGALVAGLLAGAAAAVNAVLVPVAPALALVLWAMRKLGRTAAIALLAGALVIPGAWALRGMTLDQTDTIGNSSTGRATQNLVQGSWPEYHASWRACIFGDRGACAVQDRIRDEFTLLHEDRTAGLSRIAARLCSDPPKYLAWYLAKPWLLWQWDIRMGEGDIFVYKARSSAYGWSAPYRATAAIAHALNPWLFALAALSCLLVAWRWRSAPLAPFAAVFFLVCVTGIYWVFQSEPRYSVPFRSLEILVAFAALAALAHRLRTTRRV